MHEIYFTLSRIAAIIGFIMSRRGVYAAPKRIFSCFLYFIFMYFGFRYMQKAAVTESAHCAPPPAETPPRLDIQPAIRDACMTYRRILPSSNAQFHDPQILWPRPYFLHLRPGLSH